MPSLGSHVEGVGGLVFEMRLLGKWWDHMNSDFLCGYQTGEL